MKLNKLGKQVYSDPIDYILSTASGTNNFSQVPTAVQYPTHRLTQIQEPNQVLYARKKKVAVLTSLHISIMITIALTLVSTLTSFTDLIKFVNGSRQTAIKYLTYLCLVLPLIIAFLT